MARALQILGSLVVGVKIILQVVILFFMCLLRNLQKKFRKCPESIQLWLCIKYCTDRLTLGHVQLFDRFVEHFEAFRGKIAKIGVHNIFLLLKSRFKM